MLEPFKNPTPVPRSPAVQVGPPSPQKPSESVKDFWPAQSLQPLQPGEIVEVLGPTEVAATLDRDGKLEGLPFMPEMLKFCGRRFVVARPADSLCWRGQPRRMESAVYLEGLRCDGSGHDGCGAGCSLVWKEAWLRRTEQSSVAPRLPTAGQNSGAVCANVAISARGSNGFVVCQMTEILKATRPSNLGSSFAYCADLVQGLATGRRTSEDLRTLFNYTKGKAILFAFRLWTRAPWNREKFKKTPAASPRLKAGDWIEVRSTWEIIRTLDRKACNRGMEFKPEMFRFCGKRFRVLSLLRKIVDGQPGQVREFRTDSIILESVYCGGQRSFCTRRNYYYWREIWLRRCQ